FRVDALGRRAVRVDEEVDVAVVHRLERCPRLDVDEAAGRDVDALRRLAEVHRQGPGQDDERLLLQLVAMAAALRARLVAPDVPARLREAGGPAELGDVARG